MNKQAPTVGRLVVIVGFALSCFGLLLFLWLAFGGPIPLKPQGYRVQAAFPDASTLAEQADVRVAGVTIGKVTGKELAPEGNRTLATLQIDEEYAPLRRDARAMLRQKTLLGETYIELTLGTKEAGFLPEDGRLPDGRIAEAVEFDELLRTFDPETREAFQDWQATLAEATGGRAQDLNDALGNLPVFVENAQSVTDTLNRRRGALKALINETGTTFDAITRNQGALQSFIVDNARVLETTSSQREDLADSFQIFPTFLAESRALFDRLRTFSIDTTPLVRDLEPVLEDLQPTLASAQRLSPHLERLFRDLRPLIEAGDTGLPALARVLDGLDPTLEATGPFLQQLNPILEFLELYQATVADFTSIGATALAPMPTPPPGGDSLGHALSQMIVLGTQTLPAAPERSPDNRGNAYPGPTDSNFAPPATPKSYIFPNWDCDHIGGPKPATDESPQCFVADAIQFQNELFRYPHVAEAPPGGKTQGESPRK